MLTKVKAKRYRLSELKQKLDFKRVQYKAFCILNSGKKSRVFWFFSAVAVAVNKEKDEAILLKIKDLEGITWIRIKDD